MKALSVSITRRSLALFLCEMLVLTAAVCLGAWISLGHDAIGLLAAGGLIRALLIAVICQLCSVLRRRL